MGIGYRKDGMYHDLIFCICLRDVLQDEILTDIIGILMEYVVDAENFMVLKELICGKDDLVIEAPSVNGANGYGASRSPSRNQVSSARYDPY